LRACGQPSEPQIRQISCGFVGFAIGTKLDVGGFTTETLFQKYGLGCATDRLGSSDPALAGRSFGCSDRASHACFSWCAATSTGFSPLIDDDSAIRQPEFQDVPPPDADAPGLSREQVLLIWL
jgi:hypothetical protein